MGILSNLFPGAKMFNSFLHPERGYQKGAEQLQQYYGMAQDQLNPYIQQGQQGFDPMFNAMQSLLNPIGLRDEWAQGYEASPYAQMVQEDATQSGLNAASAMGLGGSTPALQAIQRGTSMIGAQDRENYLNDMMSKYLSGAEMAQNLYGSGQQAGTNLANMTMMQGSNMGEMAYGEQNAAGEMMSKLLGAAIGAAGQAYGGK